MMNTVERSSNSHLREKKLQQPDLAGCWEARLTLGFANRGGKCNLVDKSHRGPLYVQRAFYPEGPDLAHVYLLHPPGGMVSGDRLEVEVTVNDKARVLLTTPGAGKVYKARADQSLQQQFNHIRLGREASCEWFPQENIIFNAARACLETRIDLSPDSLFQGWEITVLGLPANELEFVSGELSQRFVVNVDGRPRLIENLVIDDHSRELLSSSAGMRHQPVCGLYVAGPVPQEFGLEECLQDLRELVVPEGSYWGVTVIDGFVVIRFLGSCAEQARKLFIAVWQRLRPVLAGRPACLPRIWAT
ncbi:MAG: urease accessory protein UreD [Gammaproteobacteria bacterium]|nr:urease accessory protein UreD [Gammaproteobacteria bacterium]